MKLIYTNGGAPVIDLDGHYRHAGLFTQAEPAASLVLMEQEYAVIRTEYEAAGVRVLLLSEADVPPETVPLSEYLALQAELERHKQAQGQTADGNNGNASGLSLPLGNGAAATNTENSNTIPNSGNGNITPDTNNGATSLENNSQETPNPQTVPQPYEEMNAAQLKELLKGRGMDFPSGAKKADLIALLQQADAGAGTV